MWNHRHFDNVSSVKWKWQKYKPNPVNVITYLMNVTHFLPYVPHGVSNYFHMLWPETNLHVALNHLFYFVEEKNEWGDRNIQVLFEMRSQYEILTCETKGSLKKNSVFQDNRLIIILHNVQLLIFFTLSIILFCLQIVCFI
jgi:hypothetical protein